VLAGMSDTEWQEIKRALLGGTDVAPSPAQEQAKEP
jgi:hypothetical protein